MEISSAKYYKNNEYWNYLCDTIKLYNTKKS